MADALTEAEFNAIVKEQNFDAEVVAAITASGIFLALRDDMKQIAEDLTLSLNVAVTGPRIIADPKTLEAATRIAERQTRKLYKDLAQAELRKMGQVIQQGIIDGIGPRQIAARLDMVKGLDPQRAAKLLKLAEGFADIVPELSDVEFQKRIDSAHRRLLNERKTTIARTEQRFATSEGNQLLAKEQGKKFKAWITAGDDRVDDHCEANEAQGHIPIDKEFKSGSSTPPDHPNCRCTLAYRTAVDKAARDRASLRSKNTHAVKEAAKAEKKAAKEAAKAAAKKAA